LKTDDECITLQSQLRSREYTLAEREAAFHNEMSEIACKLQESKNTEVERRIQQKESDLLRREESMEAELKHIQKMKEDLLAKVRLLELRMQQMAGANDSPSETEYFFNNEYSPCHSTHGRSSVCSSIDASVNKKRRRGKVRMEQYTGHPTPKQTDTMTLTPKHSSRPSHSSALLPSEHLCSLQNLAHSPVVEKRRDSSSKTHRKRTPKKVFIDMNIDD
jgi:hypothetical protein